jgi:tetratricopeptide (TPR) repeat protein
MLDRPLPSKERDHMRNSLLSILFAVASFALVPDADHPPAAEPNPASCPGPARQAEAKMTAKQWPESVALWERVVALNPVVGDSWARLASARYKAKDYRKAIPAHEKALEASDPLISRDKSDHRGKLFVIVGRKEPDLFPARQRQLFRDPTEPVLILPTLDGRASHGSICPLQT